MQTINNIRTMAKMIAAFAMVILVSIVVNALSWNSLAFQQTSNGWTVHTYEVLEGVKEITAAMTDSQTGVRGFLITGKEEFLTPYSVGLEEYKTAIDKVRNLTSDNATQQKRLAELDEFVKGWIENVASKEIALMRDPATVEQARAMVTDRAGKNWMDGMDTKTAEIAADEERLLVVRQKASEDAADSARFTILAGAGGMIVLVACVLLLLQKSLVVPLVQIASSMKRLATGDTAIDIPGVGRKDEVGQMATAVEVFRQNALNNRKLEEQAALARGETEETRASAQRRAEQEAEQLRFATTTLGEGLKRLASGDISFQLNEPFAGEYESLRQDFNASLAQLGITIGSVLETVNSMDNGTREIADGAQDLSKRTEQQAASLEETAAALDEITVNVGNSSKRTEDARSVAVRANQSAAQSAQVVSHAEEAMGRIEESSQQISNIIGVIDEIAFQTNLLALNAGVEAARAGDAGKGFAVVAQEVRELAQRSANAAKEIKGLIQKSTTEVEGGVKLVRETGVALQTIGDYITQINKHMDSIAVAAKEQSVGLAEVNTAVNQMDQTTQQNAAMVEQSTAASASLAMEAAKLRDLVSQFKLSGMQSNPAQALRQTARSMAQPASRPAAPARKAYASHGSAALKSDEWTEF
ncbi:HAMP domain-containing protein [Rhizobium sp. CG5]|uniref:methyl-accepting chemotaxis protein n=1 Tax=Rhizobium sp. CG5 TaxID=2726076 RepID=UPI0020347F8B|nr:methyl-accepting chemotaxis protein [Rhizobium sp. CG5]MCM2476875.1 HAMP domain-containing protein [Rhizobium sp. CG5]